MKERILEILAVGTLLSGVFINSLGIYPAGAITMTLGTFFWLILSIMWRKTSLIINNAALLILSVAGFIGHNFI